MPSSEPNVTFPIFGDNPQDCVNLEAGARWATKVLSLYDGHPSIRPRTLILHQLFAPGALRGILAALRASGRPVPDDNYGTLDLVSQSASAIQARDTFHRDWLDKFIKACTPDGQLPIIDKIQTTLRYDTSVTAQQARIQFTMATYKLFAEIDSSTLSSVNSSEISKAVLRCFPRPLQHLLVNCREDSDENDTWEKVLNRLNTQAALADKASLAVKVFEECHNRSAKRQRVLGLGGNSQTPMSAESKPILDKQPDLINKFPVLSKAPGDQRCSTRSLKCQDCANNFEWTEQEQIKYSQRGWEPPKRCTVCRKAKKNHFDVLHKPSLDTQSERSTLEQKERNLKASGFKPATRR